MRLWLLDEVKDAEDSLKSLISVMVERADKEKDYLMPGYTHLQVCALPPCEFIRTDTICSEVNLFDGHIFCYLTHSPSATILNVYNSSPLVSPCCLWAAEHWQEIPSLLIVNS